MLLKLGVETQGAVQELRGMMQQAGFMLPDSEVFDADLDRCVRAYQEDRGLGVDGVVLHGGGKTWPRLAAEPAMDLLIDESPRAARLSRGLSVLFDEAAGRMIPEYRRSSIAAWQRMQGGSEHAYVVPLSSDGSGRHGATCGHAAWLLASWWMRALHPDRGIYPTWRTGRGPTSTMRNRLLPLCGVDGVVYGGSLHRGLKDYVASVARVDELHELADHDEPCQWYLCQRRSGHIITMLRVGVETMGCIDPRTGLPAVPGLYRLAADGSHRTRGRPWTWRRVRPRERGPWTCWGFYDIPKSGEILQGPLAGAPDLPLVLEA